MKARITPEEEIDQTISAQADADSAWEEPVSVRRSESAISLPAELASRAAFLAVLKVNE